jgi:DNA polymerase-3 subunit beta
MKLIILKDNLNAAIQHVSRAVSSRSAIPILSGIKLEATINGLTLTASDTDISIQCFIPAQLDNKKIINIFKPGSVVLPAKFFVEIVKKLPSKEIEIEIMDGYQTFIRSGSSEILIVGFDSEEYPSLPTVEDNNPITISSDVLKSMIRQTSFAVSTNEANNVFTGVLWTLKDKTLKFTACDRHRLATREALISGEDEVNFDNIIVSGKNLNELLKLLPDQNTNINIIVADNQILITFNDILFYSRMLSGTYPDTTKLIPTNYQTEVVVEAKLLIDALDRAYLLSREEKTNIVKLIMTDDHSLEISSSSTEIGKVTEQIEVKQIHGELMKVSFNSKYMLEALRAFDSEMIHFGFTGVMQPIIMNPEDGTKILQLILPYRTTN